MQLVKVMADTAIFSIRTNMKHRLSHSLQNYRLSHSLQNYRLSHSLQNCCNKIIAANIRSEMVWLTAPKTNMLDHHRH